MSHDWGGFKLEFFGRAEFDHADLMDPTWLQDWDRVRMRCGFPLTVTDDARTVEDLEALYAPEIAKEASQGLVRGTLWPSDSAHLWKEERLVRALDVRPSVPRPGDASDLTLDEREMVLLWQVVQMYRDGNWPNLGLIVETGHFHVDDCAWMGARRPYFGVGVSR